MARNQGRHRIARRTKIATALLGLSLAVGGIVVATTTGEPDRASADEADLSQFVDITTVQPNVKKPEPGDNASTGSFTVDCGKNENEHFNPDNFIAQPGVRNGAQHLHDYVGNLSTNADSNNDSLLGAGTTCKNGDESTYFWPVVRIDTEEEGEEQQGENNNQQGQQNQQQNNQQGQNKQQNQNNQQGENNQQGQQGQNKQQGQNQQQGQNNQQGQNQQQGQQKQGQNNNQQDQDQQQGRNQGGGGQPQGDRDQNRDGGQNQRQGQNNQQNQNDDNQNNQQGQNNQNQNNDDNNQNNNNQGNNNQNNEQGQEEAELEAPNGANELAGNDGEIQRPAVVDITFKGSAVEKVKEMPKFLRILYGDAKVTANGEANARPSWTCTGFEDRIIKQYPICPEGSNVKRVHTFASCLDGNNIDSENHRDHIKYPNANGECGNGLTAVPELTISLTYNIPRAVQVAGQYKVDSFPEEDHNPFSDHDDFANVMSDQIMDRLVDCINEGRKCRE